ncbi:MAG: hypothetical protein DI538_22750 [Azospira oryzae]|nr:MAG: hypothetical protein DI538_22750 [Azospira oryzae]
MSKFSSHQNQLLIAIPNRNVQDINRFRKSLLNVLAKVNIENCDAEFKESLKTVYELLSHLKIEDHSIVDRVSYEQ